MRTGKLLIKVILLGLICLVPFVSCKYDIHRFFFRGPRIDDRAASLKQLPPPFAQKNGSIQFAIITDLHFGSKRDRSEAELIQSLKNAEPLVFILRPVLSSIFLSSGISMAGLKLISAPLRST